MVGVPLLTSSDFIAMGRYVLMAFPVFAVAADLLRHHSARLMTATVVSSILLLTAMTVLFAHWMLL